MPGGFVGVDVFFVISGYLITRIILSQISAGAFSIANFYGRRARRIYPPLTVVLTTTYLIGWLVLLPDQFQLLGENIVAGVAFASNLLQLRSTGYFAPSVADNPLLHLWSLGVEEQFYLLCPLLLLLIARASRPRLWLVALAAGSLLASLSIFWGYKDWTFYSPITRAWELLAGAILADARSSSGNGRAIGRSGYKTY